MTAEAVEPCEPGSVIVDMAASALGGNVELSQVGETIVTDNGVTIVAPDNLPATMPAGASAFYARNISTLLLHLVKDGALNLDPADEIAAGDGHHARRPRRPGGHRQAARAGRGSRRRLRMSPELLTALTIFLLAILVGFEVISKVPATLHTPADVRRQLDPRHRPRGRHAHRRRGRPTR